ncbi:MAG: DUF1330 domain-containing protein [Candidatus Thiodiazotropha weberae]|uniref:DUF1330 domain-containing protein n=1 Tax=Candidatus Thiodiazotropha endoloripes TaxID=1818881 RepID=A0A1E2UHH6_9GAMM|nr:DUF1330 domain-containing protein [Candidatus Thiodiazotropha endoloripes]MCG7899181.1 DUF1330 domain-containing protein [Candidatus Thiodiazotropha weberae]MCG7913637.1 DUF1330 domain-containing protein [Candidatus Thiodiazotropha weberae]ODB92937.1 hypothetical protein A3196_19410 [Candidatus Thiodiazotropha endoloripes]
MSYYSVLDVTPTREDWIPDYIEPASRLVAQHGGKYLARTTSHNQLEGELKEAALRIIIEWPSRQAAEAFMADPLYQPHLQTRAAGSVSHHYLVEGKDDLG